MTLNRTSFRRLSGFCWIALTIACRSAGQAEPPPFQDAPGSLFSVGIPPAALVLAELNHDGILDVITANAESQNLTILFGKGDGQFRAAGQPIPVPIKPHLIVVADFNGDQNEDVAVTAHDSNEVVILKGDNQGKFPASPVRYSFLKAEKAHNHGLAVADINR